MPHDSQGNEIKDGDKVTMTFAVSGPPGASENECNVSIVAVNPGFPSVTYLPSISCNTKLTTKVVSVADKCKQVAADLSGPHKFKGVLTDQLLTDGLSVLKPLVEKEFPSALPTEVDSFLFNVLGPLVIKLQSPYTP